MQKWLFLALAATSLACSGGRDPVGTRGGDREYEGPGAADPFGSDANGNTTTSISTLVVLCTKACAHLRAADCDGAPAHTADSCEGMCNSDILNEIGQNASCADELALVYTCSMNAKVTCTSALGELPSVPDCEDEESDLTKCQSPESDCVVSPQQEITCLELGLPTFMFCSEGIEPPKSCLQVSSTGFCCP